MNEPNRREPEPTQNGGNHISGDEYTTPPGNALLDTLKITFKVIFWLVVSLCALVFVMFAVVFAGCVCANLGKL